MSKDEIRDEVLAVINKINRPNEDKFMSYVVEAFTHQKEFNVSIQTAVESLRGIWLQHAKEYQAVVMDFEKRLRVLEQSKRSSDIPIPKQYN